MGFTAKNACSDVVISVDEDGDGGVSVVFGDTCVVAVNEDGTLELCEYVDINAVGSLKLTDGEDGGWGEQNRRARIFYQGEELVLPSEIKAAAGKPAKAKKSKSKGF